MYHTPKAAPWPGGKYIKRRTHTAAIYIESEKQNLSNELNTDCIYMYKYKYNTSCTPPKKKISLFIEKNSSPLINMPSLEPIVF